MKTVLFALLAFQSVACTGALAADKLVLDLELDKDVLSLTHNVDGFLFPPTMNFSKRTAGNLADRIRVDTLKNHLAATILVRVDGKIAGVATEQETIHGQDGNGDKFALSAWLISLDIPGATGMLAVHQKEEPSAVFSLIKEVMQNPQGDWKDEFQRFLSTSGPATVEMASGDLEAYQGGRFEEYNFVNPADFSRLGYFRPRIRFIIYPAD